MAAPKISCGDVFVAGEAKAGVETQIANMNARISIQDQRSAALQERSVEMQEGIDSLIAMFKAKGANEWKGSWGDQPTGAAPAS